MQVKVHKKSGSLGTRRKSGEQEVDKFVKIKKGETRKETFKSSL